ncbi:MAG: hypothetical protein ABFS46_09115 [Myxococcota bacterium]
MRRLLLLGLALAYPLGIWAGIAHLDPRHLGLLVVALLVARGAWVARRREPVAARVVAPFAAAGILVVVTILLDEPRGFLFLPVLVSGLLFGAFVRTLRSGPSMVEAFARMRGGDLSEAQIRYCRTVTGVWCAFFALNAGVAAGLAWRAPVHVWALWSGLASYLLVGGIFVVELCYRSWRFRRYTGAITDPIFRRVFPPADDAQSTGAQARSAPER